MFLLLDIENNCFPEKVDLQCGEFFAERYEVLDELGKGTYGVVHKVKDLVSGKFNAAKFIKCYRSKVKVKAKEEIEIMNCLRHPKLLQLDAAFESPKEIIMITE